jgi:hypothetical protein
MLVEDMKAKGSLKNFMLHANCKLHLVNAGRQVGIDDDIVDTSLDPDDYDQCLSATLDMMGLLEHYHNAPKALTKATLKNILYYVCWFKYIYDCIAFEETVARALVKVDSCVPCILHLHKRIIDKLMTMVYSASLDQVSTINKAVRKDKQSTVHDSLTQWLMEMKRIQATTRFPMI